MLPSTRATKYEERNWRGIEDLLIAIAMYVSLIGVGLFYVQGFTETFLVLHFNTALSLIFFFFNFIFKVNILTVISVSTAHLQAE